MHIIILLLITGMLGCAPKEAETFAEHAPYAGMEHCLETTLYLPEENGTLVTQVKRLPWEADMEAYVLSFILPKSDIHYRCHTEDGLAILDISGFPAFSDAQSEHAAVAAIINTLLSMPAVEEVQLRFNGETLSALPHGTRANGSFSDMIETKSP